MSVQFGSSAQIFVCDPAAMGNAIKPNADGSINVVVVTDKPYSLTPLGYQQIVGMAAATSLIVPAGATIADITIEGQPIRYRDDGVAPTTTVGMLLYQSQSFRYIGNLAAIQFIQTAVAATLDISYYR